MVCTVAKLDDAVFVRFVGASNRALGFRSASSTQPVPGYQLDMASATEYVAGLCTLGARQPTRFLICGGKPAIGTI